MAVAIFYIFEMWGFCSRFSKSISHWSASFSSYPPLATVFVADSPFSATNQLEGNPTVSIYNFLGSNENKKFFRLWLSIDERLWTVERCGLPMNETSHRHRNFPAILFRRSANLDQYVRASSLARQLGIHRSTLWRWVKEKPSFPRPLKITEGVTLWSIEEVQAWLQQQGGATTSEKNR